MDTMECQFTPQMHAKHKRAGTVILAPQKGMLLLPRIFHAMDRCQENEAQIQLHRNHQWILQMPLCPQSSCSAQECGCGNSGPPKGRLQFLSIPSHFHATDPCQLAKTDDQKMHPSNKEASKER